MSENTEEKPRAKQDRSDVERITFKSIPDPVETDIDSIARALSQINIKIVGMNTADIDDDALNPDRVFVGDAEDIRYIELVCVVSERNIQFIYTIFPNREYDSLEFDIDIPISILRNADFKQLHSANTQQQNKILTQFREELKKEELLYLLRGNRSVQPETLESKLQSARDNYPEFTHSTARMNTELEAVHCKKLLFIESYEDSVLETLYADTKVLTNLYLKYMHLVRQSYLTNIEVPESLFNTFDPLGTSGSNFSSPAFQ